MSNRPDATTLEGMPQYLLYHKHHPSECGVAFACFKGHSSPLRHQTPISSCLFGGHAIWWLINAPSSDHALALLPSFVAQRSTAIEVREVQIP